MPRSRASEDATASISGVLYLDENNKNDLYDGSNLEDLVMAPNVAITLEGPSIGVKVTTQTDSTGRLQLHGAGGG